MQIDKIRGHKMTDMESQLSIVYESDRAFQKLVDGLNEIDFIIEDDIPEHDKKMREAFYKMVVEPLRKWLKDEKYEDKINKCR